MNYLEMQSRFLLGPNAFYTKSPGSNVATTTAALQLMEVRTSEYCEYSGMSFNRTRKIHVFLLYVVKRNPWLSFLLTQCSHTKLSLRLVRTSPLPQVRFSEVSLYMKRPICGEISRKIEDVFVYIISLHMFS